MYKSYKLALLEAMLPVCMKYTARDDSRVANIAHQELYTFIQTKWQCFKCFIVFYTNLTHFLIKQTGFFVGMCQ